ncbi:MAG: hypothetical protein A2286_00390 [Gammaproteobacteria bacterium RIFOXYA12_FULL_61_12]|nr:MAG: hypothetical protein A2514_11365 [Gammaproteobacteria bacterium RIFOXYD12_FULL_61_37]OGT94049.1 MAG: hypothetical protein A2286_00390 [Gammaproteobacteria bacterium RIFOXYA12_FULL_61_12]
MYAIEAVEAVDMNTAELAVFFGEVCETSPVYGAEEVLGLLRSQIRNELIRREADDSSLIWDRLYS